MFPVGWVIQRCRGHRRMKVLCSLLLVSPVFACLCQKSDTCQSPRVERRSMLGDTQRLLYTCILVGRGKDIEFRECMELWNMELWNMEETNRMISLVVPLSSHSSNF
ncbi:uncharacterized protein C8R40DRAFT_887720 [Lentinula edodes]|uniref:uncharacterized protein n=1 Tax=Lentinula edodes TaxID=5353 RepID=UPI001E8D780D|nr:uncharacterized protein C8R40DRAFT_887720 [Lentinula edodes]KAH7867957.1 hypothetical protein C8R40DRAFT_887720 [Lentinula edodes]